MHILRRHWVIPNETGNFQSDLGNPRAFTSGRMSRVLVVDDQANTRELITTVLEQCGAEVTPIASVDEALKAIKRLKPDVLVSDYRDAG